VFHVRNDYVKQQDRHFSGRKQVASQQPLETIPERLERLFLPLSIHTLAEGYEIREHHQPKAAQL